MQKRTTIASLASCNMSTCTSNVLSKFAVSRAHLALVSSYVLLAVHAHIASSVALHCIHIMYLTVVHVKLTNAFPHPILNSTTSRAVRTAPHPQTDRCADPHHWSPSLTSMADHHQDQGRQSQRTQVRDRTQPCRSAVRKIKFSDKLLSKSAVSRVHLLSLVFLCALGCTSVSSPDQG